MSQIGAEVACTRQKQMELDFMVLIQDQSETPMGAGLKVCGDYDELSSWSNIIIIIIVVVIIISNELD